MLDHHHDKLLQFETCRDVLARLQAEGKRVVLCHGVFDLVHPGHIAHLQEARELGDVLVVSITSAPFVNRGPGRPIFSDELRAYALSALQCVDYVVITPFPTALEVIDRVQPQIYCKGQEYKNPESDITQNIGLEEARVGAYGGDTRHVGSVIFSSTRLINNHMDVMPEAVRTYAQDFLSRHKSDEAREALDRMQGLKVLVVGDVIIDEFMYSNVSGLTAKGKVISARLLGNERHVGGSLAIARHIAAFSNDVTVCGVVGKEPDIRKFIRSRMEPDIKLELHEVAGYPTIVKRRYIERQGVRDTFSKLLSVNLIDEQALSDAAHWRFLERLAKSLPNYDVVVLADYGHGLIDVDAMEVIQDRSRFLALNCQTNSTNYGFNLITKYRRADTFCLDEPELRLAFASRASEKSRLMKLLMDRLGARQGWVTLGSTGSLGLDRAGTQDLAPAATLTVTDTIGAGDAFFALASMTAATQSPLAVGSLLGNLAGAMAANVLGNAEPVGKIRLLKFLATVLNV